MIPHEAWHMAEMGLSVSVAPPVLLSLTGGWRGWRRLSWPVAVALPGFIALHGAIALAMDKTEPPLLVHGVLHLLMFVGAVVFWLPVFGTYRRLDDAGRMVYLYLACPTLDLAAVWIIASGDGAAGLAMIVTMLPIGLIAMAITWRWALAEERAVVAAELLADQQESAASR